jgi:predicted RNA-binding Zn ribbon-like protein
MNVEKLTEQVEGKPAPGPLLAVQAFANTLDVELDKDLLETPRSFTAWLVESRLATEGIRVRSRDLAEARELRKTLRALLTANEQNTTNNSAARRLGREAHHRRIALHAGATGELELDLWPASSVGEFLAQQLAIVFHAQLDGTWPRLKLCQNSECAWSFYDNSRNRSGSWCRMGECGNRLKNRAYRERQRQSAG